MDHCGKYPPGYHSFSSNLSPDPSPTDIRVPPSLAYHLSDIYLEELDKAMASTQASSPLPAPLSKVIAPFLFLAARTSTSTTYKRIQSALFIPLFSALSSSDQRDSKPPSQTYIRLSEQDTYPNIVSNACMDDPKGEGRVEGVVLGQKLLRAIFEVASAADTQDSNRRKMYALWRDGAEDENEK